MGKEYVCTIIDPDTGLEVETSFDLTKLSTKNLDKKLIKGGNKFQFTLPISGRVLEFQTINT